MFGFYNRDEKCLLRGTNWVFKSSSLPFVFKFLTLTHLFLSTPSVTPVAHRLKINDLNFSPDISGVT
jgi:hypothetical protein